MNSDPSQNKIKDLKFYIPEAFRFYSIKNEYLTPILFVLALIILFGGEYIPLPGALRIIGSFFIYFRLILVNIIFLMYLSAYLKDLNGEKYTLKEIIFPDRKKLSNIITLAVINLVLFLASISIIFFIPAIIVYL
ncbi:MAG: hypothetical protein Q8942_14315, partial [Bacillota bacterium]|nr:hypothetical protein [Bacillota bacterium]